MTIRRRARTAAALGIVCAAALAIAAPAQASSCTLVSGTVVVTMPSGNDVAVLSRVGDAIYSGGAQCGTATVYNTESIFVHDTTPNRDGEDLVGINLSGGPLAPGKTDEGAGGVSEIEVVLFLYRGKNTVWVTGSDGADDIRAGVRVGSSGIVRGINLNAGLEQGKVSDADVTYQEAGPLPNAFANEPLTFFGAEGDDKLDASGGAGFDTAVVQPVTMFGANGNDHLVGGDANDTLYADAGNDEIDGDEGVDTVTYESSPGPATVDLSNSGAQATGALGTDQIARVEHLVGSPNSDVLTGDDGDNVIQGGGGDDVLAGRGEDDTLQGGPGSDTASYDPTPAGATQGVRVNLGTLGWQNTVGAGIDTLAGIENVAGSPFADELTGDAQANTLTGWEGQDSLNAQGGDDHLAVRDGTRDLVTCGPGADAVDADTEGVDSLFGDCENASFAPFVPPGGGGTDDEPPVPPSAPPPGAEPAAPPVLDQLALEPRSFSATRPGAARVRGTRVSYRLAAAATVTFGVQRARAGRRVRGACVRPAADNRGRGRCRRWLRIGSFTHSGVAGLNGLRFEGHVAGRRLRPGRYRLRVVARDAAGNRSPRRTTGFTIVRG